MTTSKSPDPQPDPNEAEKDVHWIGCAGKEDMDAYLRGTIFETGDCCGKTLMLSPDGQAARKRLVAAGYEVYLGCIPCVLARRRTEGPTQPISLVYGAKETIARRENVSPVVVQKRMEAFLRFMEHETE